MWRSFLFEREIAMEEIAFKDYKLAFDELNKMTIQIVNDAFHETKLQNYESSKDEVKEYLEDILIEAYLLGSKSAAYILGEDIPPSSDGLERTINKSIDGKTFRDRIDDHLDIGSLDGLITLVESEFQRTFNASLFDSAQTFTQHTGRPVLKQWITMQDDRVRDTHDYLYGMEIPLDQPFYTFDGDYAMYPHDFTKAENNVNCRCLLLFNVV